MNEFVELYDKQGIDFELVELEDCDFLVFVESEKLIFSTDNRAPFIRFDKQGNFIEQVL